MLPTGDAQAGPSTPTPGKRTRGAAKQVGKAGESTLAEPVVDQESGSPVAKKKKTGSKVV
jgi:hypothetical protein